MTSVVIGAIFLITILTLLTPTIDRILNDNVLNIMDEMIDNLEFFIWSNNINTLLILITLIIIIIIYKRANKFFHWND